MRILNIHPQIFKTFPEIKVIFAIGQFNFSLSDKQAVLVERQKLLETLGIKTTNLVALSQIGSDQVLYVAKNQKIDFFSKDLPEADGIYTNYPNIYLAIRTADCLPILFYNKSAGVIGAVHVGWQGTVKRVVRKAVGEVQKKFFAPIKDYYFYLGPAAQVCCYEITHHPERVRVFQKNFGDDIIRKDNEKLFLDLVRVNIQQLKDLGVNKGQIENSGICTIHNQEYPSHRREKDERREVLLSIIGIC